MSPLIARRLAWTVPAVLLTLAAVAVMCSEEPTPPKPMWDGRSELIQMPGEDMYGRPTHSAKCEWRFFYPSDGQRLLRLLIPPTDDDLLNCGKEPHP